MTIPVSAQGSATCSSLAVGAGTAISRVAPLGRNRLAGTRHVQGLVRAAGGCRRGPSRRSRPGPPRRRLERGDVVEQLGAQRLVEPLDLPRRGRRAWAWCAAAVMPFSRQTRSNSTSTGCGRVIPAGELLAVVGQHLRRHPVAAHRRGERLGDRPPGRDREHGRADHDEPGVVVDAGTASCTPARRPARPRRRCRAATAPSASPAATACTCACAAAPAARPGRCGPCTRCTVARAGAPPAPAPAELERDPPGTPPRVLPAQLADQRLDLGSQPRRARLRPPRAVAPGRACPRPRTACATSAATAATSRTAPRPR